MSFHKKSNNWRVQITINGIDIHLGYYNTKEEAVQARLNKAKQSFRIYANSCEGVKHDAKPMKISKTKLIEKPVIEQDVEPIINNIQKIIIDVVKLKNSYKNKLSKLQNQLHQVLNM